VNRHDLLDLVERCLTEVREKYYWSIDFEIPCDPLEMCELIDDCEKVLENDKRKKVPEHTLSESRLRNCGERPRSSLCCRLGESGDASGTQSNGGNSSTQV